MYLACYLVVLVCQQHSNHLYFNPINHMLNSAIGIVAMDPIAVFFPWVAIALFPFNFEISYWAVQSLYASFTVDSNFWVRALLLPVRHLVGHFHYRVEGLDSSS